MRTVASTSSRYLLRGFSEQDIIALQDVFMTNGMHDVTVTDIAQGRAMISTFVKALNYHQTIACLSMTRASLDPEIFDIYKILQAGGPITSQKLFDFFLEEFTFDLLVIENSKEVMRAPWFIDFQQQMIEFRFETMIPIICLSYCQRTI